MRIAVASIASDDMRLLDHKKSSTSDPPVVSNADTEAILIPA